MRDEGRRSRPVVPVPAATVMLLRDGTDGIEVLLLERASTTPFAPGAHVFPGGRVEEHDHSRRWAELVEGRSDAEASHALGVGRGGLAFWVAALRECLEEVSLLVATTRDGKPVGRGHPALAEARDHEDLALACEAHRLRLPAGDMAYVSHWITPEESPRRYTTRFFAVAAPSDQEVVVDDWEAVSARWFQPREALEANACGDIDLITPTEANLELLSRFPRTEAALAVLHAGERSGHRVHDPRGGLRIAIGAHSCENGNPRPQRGQSEERSHG